MSNTEVVLKVDSKTSQTNDETVLPQSFEFDRRSQEMLLVLNEVFDALIPSSKS